MLKNTVHEIEIRFEYEKKKPKNYIRFASLHFLPFFYKKIRITTKYKTFSENFHYNKARNKLKIDERINKLLFQ
jgi:hypothetical protein